MEHVKRKDKIRMQTLIPLSMLLVINNLYMKEIVSYINSKL
jgi:hypothetical protein